MMKRRCLVPVFLAISMSFLCGCAELYELREVKSMQDNRIQELENNNYNLKVEKERERAKSIAEIESLQKEVADLKRKRSEREQSLDDENFKLSRKIDSYETQLDATQKENKKQRDEFELFKAQYQSSLDQKMTDIKNLDEENKNLISANAEQKSRIEKLEKDLSEKDNLQKKTEKQLSERDSLVSVLTSQLNDMKTELQSAKAAAQTKTTSDASADPSVKAALDQAEAKMRKDLSGDVKLNKLNINRLDGKLVIHLYSDDLFEKGTVIVGEDAKPMLRKISSVISQFPAFDVNVEGHTDNTPIQNLPFLDNLALSSARADNILRFLVDEGRVDRKRVSSVACSWFRPIASNDTPEGRRENRRVEIILQPQ